MKRLVLGLCILGVLLGASGGICIAMVRIHSPIAEDLDQAAQAALQENWEQARALTETARARWEQYWSFTAAVADQTPMDELDGLFAELEVYLQQQEMPHFAATCRHLSQLARAMADSHTPSLWNLI